MNRLLRPLVALAAFAAGAFAANVWDAGGKSAPAPSMPNYGSIERTRAHVARVAVEEQLIREIYQRYGEAMTAHDAPFFEQLETDTFIGTIGGGRTVNKAQAIAEMKTWDKNVVYRNDGLRIEVYGDSAVVTRRMTETNAGDALGGTQTDWVDVLMKHDGRWRILSTTQLN